MEKEEIRELIARRFPTIIVETSESFSPRVTNGLWLKNGEVTTYTDKDLNKLIDLQAWAFPYSKHYELDVYKKFQNYLASKGWYATTEFSNLMIFPLKN